ncbi:MAG: protein-glutamate O-methyltransferase CheR [Thiotrichales bacterium]|nr:protein-glutamate O-methyltransferase CheR [Thiotrichales bacterium]
MSSDTARPQDLGYTPDTLSDAGYSAFCAYLESTCGITLGQNKQYLVNSRLKSVLEEHQFKTFNDLIQAASTGTNNRLKVQIVNAMTTNETSWFRGNYPFDILKEVIFPELSRDKTVTPKIWSAACSYGNEPYSISITLQEYLEKNPGLFANGVEITGTDISTRVLDQATKAEYDELSLSRGLSAERLEKYFEPVGNNVRVIEKIRNRVSFSKLNLLKDFSRLGMFDVVFCRNVLIYFSNENKKNILEKIESVMRPNAWLFLGASETVINYSDAFEIIRCSRGAVYRKKS